MRSLTDTQDMRTMQGAKILRNEEGDVTPDELRAVLDDLGLSQLEAARRLGVSGRTVQAWAGGTNAVPGPAERLLRTWQAHPELLEEDHG
jgi:DNA-binding transcriptional regulator YiaG